ncbi:MAG TPA: type II toxin-antitoxin system VapC family toxin [Solirubrobacteraceae bacterium]
MAGSRSARTSSSRRRRSTRCSTARCEAAAGHARGALGVGGNADLRERIEQSGLRILGLAPEHGLGVARLPMHHRDPFDRLLISQARSERMTIVTADRRFADYDVRTIGADA